MARNEELLEMSLGNLGSVEITDTTATTGGFCAIQFITDSTVSAQTDIGTTNADLTAFSVFTAGTVVFGKWSSITLATGEAIAYNGR